MGLIWFHQWLHPCRTRLVSVANLDEFLLSFLLAEQDGKLPRLFELCKYWGGDTSMKNTSTCNPRIHQGVM